jgi:hypothetical protein
MACPDPLRVTGRMMEIYRACRDSPLTRTWTPKASPSSNGLCDHQPVSGLNADCAATNATTADSMTLMLLLTRTCPSCLFAHNP